MTSKEISILSFSIRSNPSVRIIKSLTSGGEETLGYIDTSTRNYTPLDLLEKIKGLKEQDAYISKLAISALGYASHAVNSIDDL